MATSASRAALGRFVLPLMALALLGSGGSTAWALPAKAAPAPAGAGVKDPFSRGMDEFRAGRLDLALSAFREAEAREAKDPVIQSWIGFVLFKQAKFDEAIKYLRRGIELNPNNADTYNNLGNAYLAKGDVNGAIEAYRQAVLLVKDKPGSHSDIYYNLGNALVKKGDLDGALTTLLDAEKLDPADAAIQNNLGFIYERKHEMSADAFPLSMAIEHYQKAVDKEPGSAIFQRNLGLARKQAGDVDAATAALKRAVQLDAKDYTSHVVLAEMYQNAKQVGAAINEYKAAITLRPNELIPRYNLGLLYIRVTPPNFAEALTQLQAAQKIRPTDQRTLSALGYVNFKARRYEDAQKWYEKAIQVAPDFQSAHANLGLVMERQGNLDGAIQHWKEAARLDPADGPTRSLLANGYLSKGMFKEAAAEYAEVVKLDPKDGNSYNNLGFAYEKQGRLDDAIAAYKQAIEASPRLREAYNNLGACYERQGQKELARQYYQKATTIDPTYADARKNLERLGK